MSSEEAPETMGRIDAGAGAAAPFAEPPRVRVLVGAADPAAMDRIEHALRHMPHLEAGITAAGSTRAALFALASDDFDLAILDVSLLVEAGEKGLPDLFEAGRGAPLVLVGRDLPAGSLPFEMSAPVLDPRLVTPRAIEAIVWQEARGLDAAPPSAVLRALRR